MDGNDLTLSSYDDHVQEYIDGTPQQVDGDIQEWLDGILARLPKGSEVLELGSGFGRDADYIEESGYKVIRTDASKGFVALLNEQGHEAHLLNVLTDDLGKDVAMIFANAVLLHFNPTQLAQVLDKAYASLKQGAILAFTVKEGEGEEWTEQKLNAPRYFCYWLPDALREVVSQAGFKQIEVSKSMGKDFTWIQVMATK